MAAREDIERLRTALGTLSSLVTGQLRFFFGSLRMASNPAETRDALLKFVPALTTQYGEAAATIAAEWYEEVNPKRAGRVSAVLAPPVDTAAVEAKVHYLAGHLWTPEPTAIRGPLEVAVDKYVLQPSRNTVVLNSERDGVRWARVPTGAKPCAFCLVLASRGAIYRTEQSAGGDENRYHGDCRCLPTPIASDEDYPAGYLPDQYYETYKAAVGRIRSDPEVRSFLASLDPGDKNRQLKATVFAMRRESPELVRDGVNAQ